MQPLWRVDGKELFYLNRERQITAVRISSESTLETAQPIKLFDTPVNARPASGIGSSAQYAVTPDGQQFILNVLADTPAQDSPIHIIINWPEMLRRRAQAGQK